MSRPDTPTTPPTTPTTPTAIGQQPTTPDGQPPSPAPPADAAAPVDGQPPPAPPAAPPAPAPDASQQPTTPDGAPRAPEAVDAAKLRVPEGVFLAQPQLEAIATKATRLGLSLDQAQQLVNVEAEQASAVGTRLGAQLESDPELGGANFQTTKELANRGLDWCLPRGTEANDEFRAFLEATGYGNYLPLVRAMARVGRAIQEDRPIGASAGKAQPVERKSTADVLFGGASS